MNHRTLERENGATANDPLDVQPFIEQICNDLHGTVKRLTSLQELGEVIPAFASARIKTYVPLFVRRNTIRRLRAAMARGSLELSHESSGAPQFSPAAPAQAPA